MAKHVLNTLEEDFNFLLYGLSTAENQYYIVSLLNDTLNINLSLDNYIDLSHRMNKDFKFSMYSFLDEKFMLEFILIPNKSNYVAKEQNTDAENDLFSMFNEEVDESSKLIPELKRTDYLLMIKGEENYKYEYRINERLKTLKKIVTVQEIVPDTLSNKNNLIF